MQIETSACQHSPIVFSERTKYRSRSLYLEHKRATRILSLGLPIIGGMISQNILNLVDTAMVGTLGDVALAAVGMGSFANFMSVAFLQGFSTGVQAISARRKGELRLSESAAPLNAALVVVFAVGIPLSIFLSNASGFIFESLLDDRSVVEVGVSYFEIRVLGMTAIGINFAFRGFWNGVDLTRLYLQTIVVMHAANIFLNWVFIFGNLGAPQMGAPGAGLASALSLYLGSLCYIYLGFKYGRDKGFLRRKIDWSTTKVLLRLSVPSGVQLFLFATGLVVLFWIIGKIGTDSAAAATVLINVMLVAILPGVGFGLASMSLVGQAIGRRDIADAYQWAWDVVKVATATLGAAGLLMALFPRVILGVFLQEPDTLELACLPLVIFGLGIGFDGIGAVLMQSLLGAGAARKVMVVSVVLQWLFFLPLAFLVGPTLGFGLVGIWLIQTIYRALQALVFVFLWRTKRWASIQI